MRHNPIYDGPVYESIQNRFATLTSTVEQTTGITEIDNLACNSQPCMPTTSDNTMRYADPRPQTSKIQSNSFISGIPSQFSARNGNDKNVPRSSSVSIPAVKKNVKKRNKLHLTLALERNDLDITAEQQTSQDNNLYPTGGQTNCDMLTNVDEHYMVMSPASVLSNSMKGGWCELSPEDIAQKYKE